MNQAMPERLAVCFRGYICRGSPAAVKPESSSSACLQVRESCGFNRGRFQWKEQIGQRKDANYIPIESYVSCKPFHGREMSERVKVNAGYLEKTIQKCSCGKDGMVLSKKEYKKEIKKETDMLMASAYGNETRQIGLLKAALLNLNHRPTRCLAMKYEKEHGDLLQRLRVNINGEEPLKTVEEAVEAVEDFLWF